MTVFFKNRNLLQGGKYKVFLLLSVFTLQSILAKAQIEEDSIVNNAEKQQELAYEYYYVSSLYQLVDSIQDSLKTNPKNLLSVELDNGIKREVVAFFNETASPYIGIRDNGKDLKKYLDLDCWAFSFHYFKETKKLLLVCDSHSQGGDALLGALSIYYIDVNDLKVRMVGSGPVIDITKDGFTIPEGRKLNLRDTASSHCILWHDVHYDKDCYEVSQGEKEYYEDDLYKKYSGVKKKLNAGKAFLCSGDTLELSALGGI